MVLFFFSSLIFSVQVSPILAILAFGFLRRNCSTRAAALYTLVFMIGAGLGYAFGIVSALIVAVQLVGEVSMPAYEQAAGVVGFTWVIAHAAISGSITTRLVARYIARRRATASSAQ